MGRKFFFLPDGEEVNEVDRVVNGDDTGDQLGSNGGEQGTGKTSDEKGVFKTNGEDSGVVDRGEPAERGGKCKKRDGFTREILLQIYDIVIIISISKFETQLLKKSQVFSQETD